MEISIPFDRLRQEKIFLAVPMYGGQCSGMFARSVADLVTLLTKTNIQLQMYFLFNESLITRARNYCCDEFMRSDATRLLFIDSDIGFNANDVLQMLALTCMDNNEYDVIGAPYPKKCISWEKVKLAVNKGKADENASELEKYIGDYVFNPKSSSTQIALNEPVEVLEIGTGFMMIKKSCMEAFKERHKQYLSYKPDHIRTDAFDGSREILQYFQAEIDKANAQEHFYPALKKIADAKTTEEANKIALDSIKAFELENTKRSKRYLSEDYLFCQMVGAMGLKVWLCPWMKLQHVGSFVFAGSLHDLASIGAPATADASMLKKK